MEWISIKDRLPNNYERVLIFYPPMAKDECCDCVFLARYRDGFDGICAKGFMCNDVLFRIGGDYGVTHWMPLPDKPEK